MIKGLLAVSHFELVYHNQYIDNDILIVIGKKVPKSKNIQWGGDNYLKVKDFFERWHKESLYYR